MKSIMVIPLIGALAACGGGGGSSLEDLETTGTDIYERLSVLDETLASDMPSSGTVSYSGVGAYSSSETDLDSIIANPDSYSNVDVNVNFASGVMTGRAYNFKSAVDDSTTDGAINMNATISENMFSGTFSGTLKTTLETADASFTADVKYDGIVSGVFAGSNAEAAAGGIGGVGTVSGQQIPIYGAFGVER